MVAAPPQENERVADNYQIEMGGRQVEIEGICKLSEEGLSCWKPNGDKNPELEADFVATMNSRDDNYSNNFQFKFMKKNRVLILKSTVKPPPSGQFSGIGYGLMYENYSGAKEGWQSGGQYWRPRDASNPNDPQVERQMLVGSFKKDTKTFPLRYQFTESTSERVIAPFTKTEFTAGGNTYEIVSITDKPTAGVGGYGGNPYPGNMKPPTYTYVGIKLVKVVNPNMLLYIFPADGNGKQYAGFDDKGNPVDSVQLQKIQIERQKKMKQDSKPGFPIGGRMFPGNFIQPLSIDPSANYANGVFTGSFNVASSKIKKIAISVNKRTVFVFDKIQLDPKP